MDSHTQQSHNIDKQTHPKHNKPQNTCLSCSMLTHTPLKDTRKQQEHAQGFSKKLWAKLWNTTHITSFIVNMHMHTQTQTIWRSVGNITLLRMTSC